MKSENRMTYPINFTWPLIFFTINGLVWSYLAVSGGARLVLVLSGLSLFGFIDIVLRIGSGIEIEKDQITFMSKSLLGMSKKTFMFADIEEINIQHGMSQQRVIVRFVHNEGVAGAPIRHEEREIIRSIRGFRELVGVLIDKSQGAHLDPGLKSIASDTEPSVHLSKGTTRLLSRIRDKVR